MTPQRHRYDHPSAWTSKNLGGKKGITEQLNTDHLAAFDAALRFAMKTNKHVEDITQRDFPLDSIRESVEHWVDVVQEGKGILLLSGLPIDQYTKEECSVIYYGLGTYFGEAQSQSRMGDRLGQVVDIGGKDTRERAYRNSAELSLHTDASDIVGMMCLVKAMKGGVSGYTSGPAAYNHMLENFPELLDSLFEGYRYHLFGEQAPGQSPVTDHKVPVFSECDGYLSVCFLRSYIELAYEELKLDKSPLESKALDVFDEIIHSPAFRLDFMLEPGEICFFNNYVVLHTRTAFYDDPDPDKRRHLLRLWLKAWDPRPLLDKMSAYGARKGIERQEGKGTYYTGEVEYVEIPPPTKRS